MSDIIIIRIINNYIANLCPNMINFDELDLVCTCRSEERMFLSTLSVLFTFGATLATKPLQLNWHNAWHAHC